MTGASSGIGREIALQLAASGVKVAATARSADKLNALGAGISTFPGDVTDPKAMSHIAAIIEQELGPVDLAVLAAGTYTPVAAENLKAELFATTMSVNYMGVVNCLSVLLPRMLGRRAGQVAWIASVAGYRGLPKAAAYGPSKAALINLAECLKPELDAHGITVSMINPGFVETPLTAQNDFPMPFLMQAPEAARLSIKGLAMRRFEIAYPRRFVAILKIARLVPYGIYFRLVRALILNPGRSKGVDHLA